MTFVNDILYRRPLSHTLSCERVLSRQDTVTYDRLRPTHTGDFAVVQFSCDFLPLIHPKSNYHFQTFLVITSQLHGSEAEGPVIPYLYGESGPSASLPYSCDVIAGKVYFDVLISNKVLCYLKTHQNWNSISCYVNTSYSWVSRDIIISLGVIISKGNSFSLFVLILCLAANMCNFVRFFHSSTA